MFLDQLKKDLHKQQPLFIGQDTAFQAAVLVPLVQVKGEWHILFEVRSFTMRKQPGDISFPGGRIDGNETPLDAALRETYEELGVDPTTVEVIGQLSPYVASPSFVVYPYVGIIDYEQIIQSYNKEEVEELFTVPLKWLLDYEPYLHVVSVQPTPAEDFPFEKIMNGEKYSWGTRSIEEWFYDYHGYTIWGLTARILKYFIGMMRSKNG
ncbi:NUDIX hydrolase [Bacillus sp. NPDC077027]|uniref:NUDIX hydrolase n=1 Tax=Bacillus sp. NPDC077027 TaxID=3390548 RepID=UPI003CFF9E54